MKNVVSPILNAMVNEFFTEAEDDLVGLWEIVSEVEERTGAAEQVLREQTLEVVRELLVHGLVAGNPPYSVHGYRPWTDQRPDAVIDRIRSEWIALGRIPNIPDIAWFARPDWA
jgi:hypothetical protein